MNIEDKKFKIVIIDYPIYIMEEQLCSTLLGKVLHMKHLGYRATYGENVLPMDKSDFFSTHILFCEEKNDEFIPIIAYKSTSLDRCLFNNFEFPALTLMKSDGHPSCLQKVKEILSGIDKPSEISFDSSWAQNLEYRFSKNSEIKNTLREISMMFGVNHHEEYNIPHMMTCGAVKVKTDLFFLNIGLSKLNEEALFKQKSLNNEDAYIFYNTNKLFSLEAIRMSKKYKALWDNKLVISGVSAFKEAKRVA